MELPKKVSKWISTRKDEGAEAVKTNLTLDLSGITWKDVLEYAIAHLVVKWQDRARRAKEPIPGGDVTYIVPKPGTRSTVDIFEEKVKIFEQMGFERNIAEQLAANPQLIRKALAGELE